MLDGKTAFDLTQLEGLATRERQVAKIVYANGPITANAVQQRLYPEISNGAVRSMLVRLVAKGILSRRWGKRGRSQNFLYFPAITNDHLKFGAIRRLSDEYFSGSLLDVAVALIDLLDDPSISSLDSSQNAVLLQTVRLARHSGQRERLDRRPEFSPDR